MSKFLASIVAIALATSIPASAQEKTLRFVLGYPPGASSDLLTRLLADDAVHSPDMKLRLEQMGLEPTGLGPAELAKILRADYDKWGPVIKASGFKPTQ